MEEYIRKLLEQVRFKKAHKSIEGEIRSHIEDQINDNIGVGMDREEAEKAAVADMGDPIEVGISMDRIHRPRIAWSVVAIAVLIGIARVQWKGQHMTDMIQQSELCLHHISKRKR